MIKAIAMILGYVESATTSWLIYESKGNKHPSNKKEALDSLAEHLYQSFINEMNEEFEFRNKSKSHMAKCCQKAWTMRDYQSPPQRCPVCEARFDLEEKFVFNVEDWKGYLFSLQKSDCNSYEAGEDEGEHSWWPWMFNFDVPRKQMLVIQERAECILTFALGELHPEIKDENYSFNDSYIIQRYQELIK